MEPPFQTGNMRLQRQRSISSSEPISEDGSCIVEMPPLQDYVRRSHSGLPPASSCPGLRLQLPADPQPPPRRATVASTSHVAHAAAVPLVKQLQHVSLEQHDPLRKLAPRASPQTTHSHLISAHPASSDHASGLEQSKAAAEAQQASSTAHHRSSWTGLAGFLGRRVTHDGVNFGKKQVCWACRGRRQYIRHQ